MSAPIRKGDSPAAARGRRPSRVNVPDASSLAVFCPSGGLRVVQPADNWGAWTDRQTCEAGDWRLGPDPAAVSPEHWPAWTDDVAFGVDPARPPEDPGGDPP